MRHRLLHVSRCLPVSVLLQIWHVVCIGIWTPSRFGSGPGLLVQCRDYFVAVLAAAPSRELFAWWQVLQIHALFTSLSVPPSATGMT